MAIFVVQLREGEPLERARFVREGFSWAAFVFGPLWLLFNRLWLALALWIAGEALFFALAFPHVPLGAALLVDVATRFWLGCEAGHLRIDKGARRAATTGVVEARDRDEAEALFFRGAVPGVPSVPGAPVA